MQLPATKTKPLTDFTRTFALIYGEPKVGKSTFCSEIPNAIFAKTEEGLNFIEAYSVSIDKWEDFYDLGKLLRDSDHGFTTLVVDVVDIAFSYCEKFICQKECVKHVSDLPFGKGYSMVREEFHAVFNRVSKLGLGIMFVSHSKERTQKDDIKEITVMGPSLAGTGAKVVNGMCDFILYGYINRDGERLIRTKPTKNIIAGDRTGQLPELIEFNYGAFEKAFEEATKKENE